MRFLLLQSLVILSWLLSHCDGFLQSKPSSSAYYNYNSAGRWYFPTSTISTNIGDTAISKPGMLFAATAISSNEELKPGIAAIDAANPTLYENLSNLRNNPYFRLFSVDILASCEYMPQELVECYSETCEIYPVDEDEVPEKIKSVDSNEFEFDIDGWARWDMPTEDYYDIKGFPEGYTGYDGREVWEFIHNRICFQGYGYDDNHWKADFNKAVSGLHSMISAQVNRGIQERVDNGESFSDDEVWRDPDAEFQRRLSPTGDTPLALENLYFSYMLLLAAASKVKSLLLRECQAGKIDEEACGYLQAVLDDPVLTDETVNIASQKLFDHTSKDSSSAGTLWEARMRTRELVRIMNCVQCNKCRLHGKISTMGLSTALQILVGPDGKGGDISSFYRVELATLMATLHKFATAVNFCQKKLK